MKLREPLEVSLEEVRDASFEQNDSKEEQRGSKT